MVMRTPAPRFANTFKMVPSELSRHQSKKSELKVSPQSSSPAAKNRLATFPEKQLVSALKQNRETLKVAKSPVRFEEKDSDFDSSRDSDDDPLLGKSQSWTSKQSGFKLGQSDSKFGTHLVAANKAWSVKATPIRRSSTLP